MDQKKAVIILAAVTAIVLLLPRKLIDGGDQNAASMDDAEIENETLLDTIGQTMDQVIGSVAPGPVADMYASGALRNMLKNRERLRLERYNLGDGGWTIGYGHYEKNINNIPASITEDEANAMFDRDIAERGEKWVRLYVTVPLQQYEFDALVHIAYNLSPKGFKKFADAVNAGQGIDYIAEESTSWPAPSMQNGVRNRRNTEVTLFNTGQYA